MKKYKYRVPLLPIVAAVSMVLSAVVVDDANERLTAADVIVHSSNVGISQIAMMLSGSVLRDGLRSFGIGSATAMDLRENYGRIMSAKAFEREFTRASAAYGYGLQLTPMQILNAYNMKKKDTTHTGNGSKSSGSTKANIAVYTGVKTISPLESAEVVKAFGNFRDKTYHMDIFNESITLKAAKSNAND